MRLRSIFETCQRKRKPNEESHVPAQKDELKDRDADQHIPEASGSQLPASTGQGIPSCDIDGNAAMPHPQANSVDTKKKSHLEADGIA